MIKNKLSKILKTIILTMVLFIMIIPLFNNSYAKPGTIVTDIKKIDKNQYPGIVERIEILKKKYPNWKFEFYKTGLDWNGFIGLEYAPERNTSPFNLVPMDYKGGWVCDYRGTKLYDSERWIAASYHAIEYAADPRNYINESDIFTFKTTDKRNTMSKVEALKVIREELKGASYVNQAETIYNVSHSENVDFVDVIARILQEQGYPKPNENGVYNDLINGALYEQSGKKYYNPFNVGATGNTNAQVFANGLKHAKNRGWDTFEKGLRGGIELVKNNYEKQNSSYFEKFNSTEIDYSGITNQYMQNIIAPLNEGRNKRDAYRVFDPNLTGEYTFVIPLYENMQKVATERPNSALATPKGKTYKAPTNPKMPTFAKLVARLNLRTGPGTEYDSLGVKETGTFIRVLKNERAAWYEVELIGSDQKGYMARTSGSLPAFNYIYSQTPAMEGKTIDYWTSLNQDTAKFPVRAQMAHDGVKIRKGPSTSDALLKTAAPGEIIEVIGQEKNSGGYTWYKINYELNAAGTKFNKTGYMSRGDVGSKDYWFMFLDKMDYSVKAEQDVANQKNPKLYQFAVLESAGNVRRGSGSLSSPVVRLLPKGTRIQVTEKVANKDGYEWYKIYYNHNGKNFNNTGYMARNPINTSNYRFKYIINPDWTKCEFMKSDGTTSGSTPGGSSSSGNTSSGTASEYPKTAKTTTSINVRKGSGSTSSAIVTTLSKNAQIEVKKKMPNKNGYEWYHIGYNYSGGKYKNSGYIARNAVGSKDYFFDYVTTSGSTSSGSSSSGNTSSGATSEYPKTAKTTTSVNVRRGSGSTSSAIATTLSKNAQIEVKKKMPNKNGYEWYHIGYNYSGGKYKNSGYIARNAVGSKDYFFNYVTTSTGSTSSGTTSGYPKTARTTTSLNVRGGSGSTSSPIVGAISPGTQISVRSKKVNKNGYEWYFIYYNLVGGKYKNYGYIARNAVGSKDYYFNY